VGDELAGPPENSRSWIEWNPCPDELIGSHLRAVLLAHSEMPGASVPRMMALRDNIGQQTRAIDRQQTPRGTK
jgi:hypothetical protein